MKKIFGIISAVAIAFAICSPLAASSATDTLSLTITPPFFQLNVSPGDAWSSSIKVVNTNPAAITVYASLKGFTASDEEGHGTFIDLSALAGDQDALANWISVSSTPITIPSGGSADIPFTILVPNDASPGGHYAAILVGTEPGGSGDVGSHVGVSSFISSLIFVRVSGDISEAGRITEFSTDKSFYQEPDVQFTLRFQNTGNVHVRPVGEVEIYNAWGKERGKIDINQSSDLGYVLPSSTRKFDFEWKGAPNLFDIGQYSAVVTLAYGANGSKNVSQTVTFWIIPVWQLVEVVGGTLFFLIVLIIAIRRYVRRALSIEMKRRGIGREHVTSAPPPPPSRMSLRSLAEPVTEGVVDLRAAYRQALVPASGEGSTSMRIDWRKYFGSLKKYLTAAILLALVVLGVIWAVLYIKALVSGGRSFEVKNTTPGQETPWISGTSGH